MIFLITFFAFSPALFNGFIFTWDDPSYLLNNPLVCSLALPNVWKIFTTPINGLYTPLTTLSFALEHRFFGFAPWIYHLDDLLLHLGVVGAVLVFSKRIGLSNRAAFSGSLFAIHPIHVESVAWAAERKDCLYAFFYMLASVQYVEFVNGGKRVRFYWSLGWGLLSILAKPMAISLPLVLLALDWYLRRPLSWTSRIKEKMFYLVYMVPLAAITCRYWPFDGGKFKIGEGVLIWVWSFVTCVEKFFDPRTLLPHYELPQPVLWYHPVYISAVLVFAVFVYSIYRFRKNRTYVFAWGYYFLSIFFILKVQNGVNTGNLSWIGDRFMYLPSLGFCLWMGILFDGLLQIKRPALRRSVYCSLVILFCILSFKTFLQAKIWKNDLTLWGYVIKKAPEDTLAYVERARAYERLQEYDLAIADDSKAIAMNPGHYVSQLNVRSPVDDAQLREIDRTNTILLNNPYYVTALRHRGRLYQKIQRNDLALKDLNEVLKVDPKDGAGTYP